MVRLHLRLLGPFEACVDDGAPIRIPARKAVGLFAYLALHGGEELSRDTLAALLWGMSDPEHARGSLRQAAIVLRDVLGANGWDGLRTGRHAMSVSRDALTVDVHVLETLAGAERAEDLARAARLCRGLFLEGYVTREAAFAEWVEGERRRLQELALDVLGRLLRLQLRSADPEPAAETATRLLRIDPLQESAHRALMALYARQGRGASAIAQYRTLERLLRRELDIAPEPETTALLRGIERDRGSVPPGTRQTASGAEIAPEWAPPVDGSDESQETERKQVTVLCATATLGPRRAEEGPEAWAEAMRHLVETLCRPALRYGGRSTVTPDGRVFATFGAPLGQEHHAGRACLAALSMRAEARGATDDASVAIGIASGIGVLNACRDGREGSPLAGPVAARAAALAREAGAERILVARETRSLAGGQVTTRPCPTSAGPGSGMADELVATVEPYSRWAARASAGLTRLVGRDRELAQLVTTMEAARSGGGRVVGIVGGAGVGKSRLVHELLQRPALREWAVVGAGALPWHADVPYRLIGDMFRAWLGTGPRDSQEAVASALQAKVAEVDPRLASALPALCSLLDLPVAAPEWLELTPFQRRRHIAAAVKAFVHRAAEARPHLIVLEDLHWADAESGAVLDTLIDTLPASKTLLIVTFRPELRRPAWADRSYYSSLHLGPLDEEATAAFLRALLAEEADVDALLPIVLEATAATPLFLEEVIRVLADDGILTGQAGDYRLHGRIERVRIPSSVQAVLAARIDRLAPEAKRVLHAASVVGRNVPAGLFAAVLPMPADERMSALAELVAAELLHEMPQLPEPAYRFKHALTQSAAYDSLPPALRRRLHARVVVALEEGSEEAPAVELLAHHLAEAGLTERAAEAWARAGTAALARSAMREAAHSLSRAVELVRRLPATPERRRRELDQLTALGIALNNTSGPASAETQAAYERAEDLSTAIGDRDARFRARWNLWRVHNVRAESDRAVAIGEALLREAADVGDVDHQLQAHHALWSTYGVRGDLEAMCAHVERGLALYDTDRHREQALVFGGHDARECGLTCASMVLFMRGYPDRARASHAEGLRHAAALGQPQVVAHAYTFGSFLLQLTGALDELEGYADALAHLADEHGLAAYEPQARFYAAWLAVHRERDRRAIRVMRDFLDRRAAMGTVFQHPYFLLLLADASLRIAEPEAALAALDEGLAYAGATGEHQWTAELHRLRARGELMRDAGERDMAEASLEAALADARCRSARLFELRAATDLARLWADSGQRSKARELLTPVYGWFTEGFDTADLEAARTLLDEIG